MFSQASFFTRNKDNIFLQPILFGQFSVNILKDALAPPRIHDVDTSLNLSHLSAQCYGLLGLFLPSISRLGLSIFVYKVFKNRDSITQP